MNKIKLLLITGIFMILVVSLTRESENMVLGASVETPDYTFENEDTIILHSSSIDKDNKALLSKFEKVKHIKIDLKEANLDLDCLTFFPNVISLYIPANITTISFWYTDNLPNLKEFIVDEKNPAYSSIDGVLYNKSKERLILYPYNGKKDAVVEAGTKIIGINAFKNIPINSIYIPEGVILIERYAFSKTNLTEITLPASFRTFEYDVFENTPLTKVIISEKNKSLTSIDGAAYRKDKSYLYYWPEEKIVESLDLPQGLTYLNCSMIKHFDQVKQITIPDSLTAIIETAGNQIEQIFINNENPYLKLYDGVLYSRDYKKIRLYPNQNKDTDITLHNNLEVLTMDLFYIDNTTKVLTLPKNLKMLKGIQNPNYRSLLSGFENLSELKMNGDHKLFVIENGILYNKEKTHILWYPIDLPGKEFKVPDTVTLIDNDQLVKQNHLEKLIIPDNCMLYDLTPFNQEDYGVFTVPAGRDCPKLKEFVVTKRNPYYTAVDGVLFSKNMTRLLMYPTAKTDLVYQIPDTVEIVLFENENHYLQTLKIPASVVKFGTLGFVDGDNYYLGDTLLYFSALKEFEVVPSNEQRYASVDGVLYVDYNTSKKLIAYPVGKTNPSFYLPKDVEEIEDQRYFDKNPYLKDIYIDSGSQYFQIKNGELWSGQWRSIHLDNITLHNY